MECEKIRPFLDDFAEGELRSPHTEIVEEHLKACPSCQRELSATRQTIRLLAEFREVDEPPDFVQQVRERIEKRQKRSVLDRLFPRPSVARVLASVSCLAIAVLGAWLVYKQFAPTPPPPRGGVAKARGVGRSKPVRLARASRDVTELPLEKSRKRGRAFSKGARQREGLAKAEEAEKAHPVEEFGRRLGYPIAADERVETGSAGLRGSLARKTGDKKGDKSFPVGPTAATQHGTDKANDVAGEPLTLSYRFGRQQEAKETLAFQPAGTTVTLSGKRAAEASAAPVQTVREKAASERPTQAATSNFADVPAARAPVGTAASTGRSALAEAGSDRGEEREKDLLAGDTRAKGMPPEIDGDQYGHRQLGTFEKATEAEDALSTAGLKAPKPSRAEKEESGLAEHRNDFYWLPGPPAHPEEGATGREQMQAFDANGSRQINALFGEDMSAERYYAPGGTVPELVLAVKDREKALAEIRKLVTSLGGETESAAQKGKELTLGVGASLAYHIIVKLKANAYEQFREKLMVRLASWGLSGSKAELRRAGRATQLSDQEEGTVTFCIRLVEIREQEQTQQPPER